MSRWQLVLMCLLGMMLLSACGQSDSGAGADLSNTQVHAPGLYDVSSLDVYADRSRLHLLLTGKVSPESEQTGVRYLRSSDAGQTWSRPVSVPAQGPRAPFQAHRGNDAQIAARGQRITAAWPVAGEGWGSTGPLVTAFSDDGGASWKAVTTPGAEAAPAAQGLLDLAYDANAVLHAVWLDSRDGSQGLRASRSQDAGKRWSDSTTLDAQTCECCRNTLAADKQGAVYVLYRNTEPRDMALASRVEETAWKLQGPVGDFQWQFEGCPHTGGGLAASASKLHALVWTGKPGQIGLYYMNAENPDMPWSAPHKLGGDNSGHPDLAAAANGRLLAVWDTRGVQGYAIKAAVSNDNGQSWQPEQTLYQGERLASHPRVSAAGGSFQIFWTEETGEGGRTWRSRRLSY